jgi:GNAT superfamily N-acetyltransferase
MGVEVQQISARSKGSRARFVDAPWPIYRDYPHWVPPLKVDIHTMLNPEKHPYHQHAETALFLAYRNGAPVGRIAAHVNHAHQERWRDGAGFFGFYECVDDQEVADALVGAAAEFLHGNGCSFIRGPFSWTPNEEVGLLVDRFDSDPAIMMPYNPPYYSTQLERAGFAKAKDLLAYWVDDPGGIPERLERGIEIAKKRNQIEVRPFRMKRFWDEVELLKKLYNTAWEDNWSSVPMTDAEIEHLAKDLKMVVDPEIVYFAYVGGELAGFSLSLPDANQAMKAANGRLMPFGLFKIMRGMKRITHIRVLLLGILPQFRNTGVDVALYRETFDRGRRRGYTSAEMSWILEDNYAMRNPIQKFGGREYKTYRVYDRAL